MKKTYFAILGAAAILSLATACSSKNVNEPTANESSQSASSESSSNGMDESSPMDDLKEDAKDAVLPSEGTADAKQSTMTGTISDIKYGNRKMNERTGTKTQALCAVRITFREIPEENTLHDLSGKVIKLKDPQIVKQFDALDKTKPDPAKGE